MVALPTLDDSKGGGGCCSICEHQLAHRDSVRARARARARVRVRARARIRARARARIRRRPGVYGRRRHHTGGG